MLPLAARPDLDGGEELAPGVVACGGRVFKEIVPGDPALLRQVVESLSRLRHPGLARVEGWVEAEGRFWVVMERVPGRTLEEEIRARAPLSAGQAAGWTADLCGALDYLVEQGRPEMLLALSPDHVMVTPEGHLKLINYGLSRPGQPVPPGAGQAALGRILARLAGGSAQEGASGLPADLAWIVARCTSGDPARAFPSFGHLEHLLRQVARPAARAEGLEIPPPPFPRREKVRRPWLRLWILLALVALAGLARLLWPRPALPAGDLVLAAVGRQLLAFSAALGTPVGSLALQELVSALAEVPGGRWLLACQPGSRRLAVLEARTGRTAGSAPLGPLPGQILVDPGGRMAVVLHPRQELVCAFALEAIRRGQAPELRCRLMVEVAVGPPPQHMALWLTSSGERLLAVGSASSGRLSVFRLEPFGLQATARLPSPGALAVSSGGRTLFVARPDEILALDAGTLGRKRTLRPIGGHDPVALQVSPDGRWLWSLNRSGSLGVLEVARGALAAVLPLDGEPAGALLQGRYLWVRLADPPALVVLDPASRSRLARIVLPAPADAVCLAHIPRK